MRALTKCRLLCVLGAALLSGSAWAADGDAVTTISGVPGGGTAWFLCDTHLAAAADTCAEFDLVGRMPIAGVETATITMHQLTGCDTPIVATINTNMAPTGSANCGGDASCEISFATVSDTVREVVIEWASARPQRFLNIDLSQDVNCTNLDIIITFYPPPQQN